MTTIDPNAGHISYSQRGEDQFLVNHFKGRGPGRFLDIGAADGKTFSNVRRLYETGWTGVLVEGSPLAFPALIANYPDPERAILILAVVVPYTYNDDRGLLEPFHVSPDMVSSLSDEHRKKWSTAASFRTVLAPQVSISGVLCAPDVLGRYFDLISIDVEGSSGQLFAALPNDTLGAEVVIVEYDDAEAAITAEATRRGFRVAHKSEENLVLVRDQQRSWMVAESQT